MADSTHTFNPALQTGDPALIETLRARILARGPLPFAEVMAAALYHPAHGYYSSGRAAIGRGGDYFTNVSVGPLFGRLLAAQFAEMWEKLGRPRHFLIVEQGAHQGDFARDVLAAAHEQTPDFFSTVAYVVVEPFPVLRALQETALTPFAGKVSWRKNLDELEPFTGVHFSNELLDAMPVHLVATAGGHSPIWRERYVSLEGDRFAFTDGPLSDSRLAAVLGRLALAPEGKYETEVNLAALAWIDQLSAKLVRGYVLVADYGYARDDFYAPHRAAGTLASYAAHRRLGSPLDSLGTADLTAHLEWTTLAEQAGKAGLGLAGFTDQTHFITGLAAAAFPDVSGEEIASHEQQKARRALQTLLHPNFLGLAFQWLLLTRGTEANSELQGFHFARDARSGLGLSGSPGAA